MTLHHQRHLASVPTLSTEIRPIGDEHQLLSMQNAPAIMNDKVDGRITVLCALTYDASAGASACDTSSGLPRTPHQAAFMRSR
jgi:hypothetical protein